MKVFFSADSHFFHRNIITMAGRPFASLEEMHEALIDRWNRTVSPRDIVYHLGDLSFGKAESTVEIVRRLSGHVCLVPGNHDKRRPCNVELLPPIYNFRHEGIRAVLSHYPLMTWEGANNGAWMLHGHSHGNLDQADLRTTRLDVGVDSWLGRLCNDYAPIPLEQIVEVMRTRSYRPVDHHKAKAATITVPM